MCGWQCYRVYYRESMGKASLPAPYSPHRAFYRQKTTRIPACICRLPPPAVLITPNVARFDIFVPGELKFGEFVTLSACIFTSKRNRSWIGNDLYKNAFSPNPEGERSSAR